MACRTNVNSNNFLLWQSIGSYTLAQLQAGGLPDICNHTAFSDQYTNVNNQINYLIAGETLAFYANLDTADSSGSFASWRLDLVHNDDFIPVVQNVGALTKDSITGSTFRFYSSFTVPAGLTEGDCYYLVIVDTSDSNDVEYISKHPLQARGDKREAFNVRYRNQRSILNYTYTGSLNNFYNQFWISLAVLQPAYPTTRVGYTKVQGDFQSVRSLLGETKQFITRDYNADMHQAFNAATMHSEFAIYELGAWTNYARNDDSSYDIGWQDEFPLAHGEITLERAASYSSNKAL